MEGRRGICLTVIKGTSMSPALRDGDTAVLSYHDHTVELPPLGKDEQRATLDHMRSLVPDNSIIVFRINHEPPAVKRIKYRHKEKWYVELGADNEAWGLENNYPRLVSHEDHLYIYARVIGVGV